MLWWNGNSWSKTRQKWLGGATGRPKESIEGIKQQVSSPKKLHKRCQIRFSDDDATKNVDIFVGIDSCNNDDDVKGGADDSSVVIAVVDSQQVFLLLCLWNPSSPAREINLCENVKLEKPVDSGLEKSVYQAKFWTILNQRKQFKENALGFWFRYQ